jgi:hypothetical protein
MTIGLVAALALPLWLNAASVTASISDRQVAMGESVQYQVTVDAEDPQAPDITPLQKDFIVQDLGSRRFDNTTIVNGRISKAKGTVYTYSLTPRRVGTLPLLSLTISADGQDFKTPSGELVVVAAANDQVSSLEMIQPSRTVYVGESVPVTLRWILPAGNMQIANVVFTLPSASDGSQLMPIPDSGDGNNMVSVAGLRERVGVRIAQEKRDGQLCSVVTLSLVWQPRQAGTVSLSSPVVRFQMPDQRRRRTPADEFPVDIESFLNRQPYKTCSAVGPEASQDVKPLPAAGRPAGFFGLVGKVSVGTAATPLAVRVGDPVTLTVKIGPAGLPMEILKKVDLRKQAALVPSFKLANEAEDGQLDKEAFVITRTIRPLTAGTKEIPAIEIPYFDSATGQYQVARSQPIPLSVEGVKEVSQAEIGAAPSAPAAVAAGLAGNAEGAPLLVDQRVGLAVWRDHVAWLACLLGAPLAWLLIAWLAWQRRQAGAAERALERQTLAALHQELKREPAVPASLQAAFLAWLGACLRMPPGVLTFADLAARGLGRPETLAVFTTFDLMRYGGAAAVPAAEIRRQVEQALAALENRPGNQEERR